MQLVTRSRNLLSRVLRRLTPKATDDGILTPAAYRDDAYDRLVALALLAVIFLGALFAASRADASMDARIDPRQPSQVQLLRLRMLQPYIEYFTSLSYGPNESRVSPDYLKALILTESGGDHWAHSRRGARGLTQIIPATARRAVAELAAKGEDYLYIDERIFEDFNPDYLYEPAVNLLIACHLSATYQERFDGRTDLVAAAWNAGPGSVADNQPPPYTETRNLISRVLGYMEFFASVSAP